MYSDLQSWREGKAEAAQQEFLEERHLRARDSLIPNELNKTRKPFLM
jgi:hypothetical protein